MRILCGNPLLQCQRLPIICIIVTAGQSIVSEKNPALHLFAKTLASGIADQFLERIANLTAMTILDSIITREVRRCLGGCNQIICSNCIFQAGHTAFYQLCAHGFIYPCSLHDRITNLRINAFPIEFLRNGDFQALDFLAKLGSIVFHIPFRSRSIMRIISCNRIQNPSTVFCILGNRPDLIQRRSKCHQTITGNTAIGRLQTGYAAKRCRLTN